jgi:hypothetical protein
MARPGDGFVSNGHGVCKFCALPRVSFGFMPEKCVCMPGGIVVVSDQQTIEAVKTARRKRADKTAQAMSV